MNDTLIGGSGHDIMYGDSNLDPDGGPPGDDILVGGGGPDSLRGGPGNDHLTGGPGDEALAGAPGDDQMIVTQGDDRLFGGPGNDIYFFAGSNLGTNTVYEPPNVDTSLYNENATLNSVSISGGFFSQGFDTCHGAEGQDTAGPTCDNKTDVFEINNPDY
jgi:Ca2+-binding RTX toxin-like protein